MKILVIGASGFIGNACFSYFSQKAETVGVDRINTSSNTIIIDDGLNVIPALIDKKFDVILNCAGSSNIQNSFSNTDNDLKLNVTFVKDLLELVRTHSPATKVINLSSAAVYGDPKNLPIKETDPCNPLSPYGFHKQQSEQIIKEYHQKYNLNTLSVRIFSAYGPGLKRQFFYDLFSKFNSGNNNVDLYGTGKESRDFVFISDIVDALDILITKGSCRGEIYNIASGKESFINATAELFSSITGYTGKLKFTNEHIEGYPINWRADISKINAIGFSPKIELQEGLNLYYSWLKKEQVK